MDLSSIPVSEPNSKAANTLEQENIEFETGIQCLCLAARLFHLPASPQQLSREFSSQRVELNSVNVVRAAKHIGLKAKLKTVHKAPESKEVLPTLAKHKTGYWFLILQLREESSDIEYLIFDPVQKATRTVNTNELANCWSGEAILLTKRSSVLDAKTKFGLSWFLPSIKKYGRLFSDVLIASFFIQLLGLATPIFFQVVIDKVLVHRGLTTLDVLAIGFFFVITFEVILTGLKTYLFAHTTNRIDVELGSTLYKHLLALPLNYFANTRVGQTVARVKELDTIREFITGTSLTLLLDVLFSVLFIAFMFFYAPLLTWIIVGTIPCYIILSYVITPFMKKRLEEKFQKSAENHAFLVESVSGAETIKSLAIEPQLRNQWDEKLADYVATSFRSNNISNIYSQVASYINKVSSLLTLYFGSLAVVAGELTVGQFIAFNMLAQRVTGPIMRLVNLWQDFQQANISLKRLGDILDLPTEPGYNPNRASLSDMQGSISFENVSFQYSQDSNPVISNMSFEIKKGEVIGVVGKSGSGKSTITKLIQRLYQPNSGKVLVDGFDLALIDPSWLRRNVGVVLQESFLFNRSIRENIAISDLGMPMENVVKCAKLAGAHEFISALPEGYDTMVEEHGSSLSGGQKQRLAIARALTSDPKILIFDEATSALDYQSESIIQKNMEKIVQGRTVFIIAHRLSAVRHANRILVIENGEIIQSGPHQELVMQPGVYSQLNALQGNTAVEKKNPNSKLDEAS